jgi:hypothetical protein
MGWFIVASVHCSFEGLYEMSNVSFLFFIESKSASDNRYLTLYRLIRMALQDT